MIESWREFWDRPHRIYVNERHRRVHYERAASEICSEIPGPDAIVLDYGCGEALEADRIAAACKKLFLCESGSSLRSSLRSHFNVIPNINVITPEEVSQLPDGELDLVVANSVLQYLSRQECVDLLRRLRPKLSPSGRLILADIIPPDTGLITDVTSLLRTAAENGFFFAALGGLAHTLISDYRRLRRQIGLTTYTEHEILELLTQAGYAARRRSENFGFNQNRMAFVAELPKAA